MLRIPISVPGPDRKEVRAKPATNANIIELSLLDLR